MRYRYNDLHYDIFIFRVKNKYKIKFFRYLLHENAMAGFIAVP